MKEVGPRLIEGALSVDDRGSVSFVNEFNFAGVKRCASFRETIPNGLTAMISK